MKHIINPISRCKECPFCQGYSSAQGECAQTGKLTPINRVPDWCPLEDDIPEKAKRAMISSLRYLSKKPCIPDNCGTACLCPTCNARLALAHYDPEWNSP